MRVVLLLLMLLPFCAIGQKKVPLGSANAADTNLITGNFMVTGAIRLPGYKTTDPSWVLGTDAAGNVTLRQVPSTSSFIQYSDTSSKIVTRSYGLANYYPRSSNPAGYLVAGDIAGKMNKGDSTLYTSTYNNDTGKRAIRRVVDSGFVALGDSLLGVREALDEVVYLGDSDVVYVTPNDNDTAKAAIRGILAVKLNTGDTTVMLQPYLRKGDTVTMLSPYLRKGDTTVMLAPYLRKRDTVTLSNRIDLKLNTSDTAAMLGGYYRSSNPAGYITTADIAGKLNTSDTTVMLSAYLRKGDTTSMLSPYLRKGDTASMLAPYQRSATAMKYVDTVTLSNRINLKLNSADTAGLSNRINLKLNASDSTTYQSKYRSDTMRANVYAAIATKGVGSVTSFTVAGYMNGVGTNTTSGTFSPDTSAGKLATKTDLTGYTVLSTANAQSGTTYTLVAGDRGKVIAFTSSSAVTVTVPSGLGSTFYCTIQQNGTGQVTLSAGAGVTLRNRNSYTKTAGQYAMCSIIFSNTTDAYNTQGDMQ